MRKAAAEKERAANERALERRPGARVNWHHRNFLDSWWRLSYRREDFLAAVAKVDRYISVTRTSSEKRGPVFTFVDAAVHLGDTAVAFDFSDDYSFGILQSSLHELWFRERCTTLETRLTYTSKTVFDSFVWPQSPDPDQVNLVASLAAEIINYRAERLDQGVTLAAQYDVLREPGKSRLRDLHGRLNSAVIAVYGFDPKLDLLTQLLSLNLETAQKEEAGEVVTPPGPGGAEARVSDWRMLPKTTS